MPCRRYGRRMPEVTGSKLVRPPPGRTFFVAGKPRLFNRSAHLVSFAEEAGISAAELRNIADVICEEDHARCTAEVVNDHRDRR